MARGDWMRYDARRTVESVLSLDLRVLYREGLRGGSEGTIRWAGGWGEPAVQVIHLDRDSCLITYSRNRSPKFESVDIEWTPCHFGAERPWWRCPARGRRWAPHPCREGGR